MNSLQRIFDAAWEHFIINKSPPAVSEDVLRDGSLFYTCQYRTKDGLKCAVGLCIPDGHPVQVENSCLPDLVVKYPDLFPDLVDDDPDELEKFQAQLHDDLTNRKSGKWICMPEEMREHYLLIADEYNLKVPE